MTYSIVWKISVHTFWTYSLIKKIKYRPLAIGYSRSLQSRKRTAVIQIVGKNKREGCNSRSNLCNELGSFDKLHGRCSSFVEFFFIMFNIKKEFCFPFHRINEDTFSTTPKAILVRPNGTCFAIFYPPPPHNVTMFSSVLFSYWWMYCNRFYLEILLT